MYLSDGLDLDFVFKDIFPYYKEGFRLKKLERTDLEGYDADKEALSMPMDHNLSYGRLVNNKGIELGIFQSVNNRTKVVFNSDFIFSQLNDSNHAVSYYYLTFAFYINNDFTFKSFSFDFLYDFKQPDKSNSTTPRYKHHIEVILEDDFIKITTDGVDYDLGETQSIFEILPDFVLAAIYNSNEMIEKEDNFDLSLIVKGQKINNKKMYQDLLSMVSF